MVKVQWSLPKPSDCFAAKIFQQQNICSHFMELWYNDFIKRVYFVAVTTKGVLLVISDTQNAQTPKKEKKTYTVEEIAEQLNISKKAAYSLVKSGQFSYVRAGRAIRVSKVSFDKWLNQI